MEPRYVFDGENWAEVVTLVLVAVLLYTPDSSLTQVAALLPTLLTSPRPGLRHGAVPGRHRARPGLDHPHHPGRPPPQALKVARTIILL